MSITTERRVEKIVLAFDSFKGSLSSEEAAEAALKAVVSVLPDCETLVVPVADGGEGTVAAICANFDHKFMTVECCVNNPLMHKINASYNILPDDTAVIETASASGLTLLADEERNPLDTTTYGTGELIFDAMNRGCRKFIIGLGGSATNDAAMGILSALGYKFKDSQGELLKPIGANLIKVCSICAEDADARLKECSFNLACDVTNTFCGKWGAAYIYAPQKGADADDVIILDEGLRHFADVLDRTFGVDVADMQGAGAAGGIGGTLCAVLGAKLSKGIDVVLDCADFDRKITDADLILTGEGSIDEQSGMGKTISGIVGRAKRCSVPVVALAGNVKGAEHLNKMGLKAVFSIQQGPVSLKEAMQPENAAKGIYSLTTQILKLLK